MKAKSNRFIRIPVEVLYDENLQASAKLLFGEILSLADKKGICWANNTYFANKHKKHKIYISNLIAALKDAGYISIQLIKNDNGRVENRLIKILIGINENLSRGIKRNLKDNNINNNNIINDNINYNNNYNNNDNIIKKEYTKNLVFDELVLKCYENVVKLFDERYRPKNEQQKNKWLDTIDKLNRIDKYNPRQVFYITKKTLMDDFWKDNFMSIHKLRQRNRQGVKWIDAFAQKYAKDMIV